MSTYFMQHGFSSNEIVGGVVEALLHDLHLNNFTVPGFPQVNVAVLDGDDGFEVTLVFDGRLSPSLRLDFATGKRIAKRFRAQKGCDPALVRNIQDLISELERSQPETVRTN